jgi:Rrf2 family protein
LRCNVRNRSRNSYLKTWAEAGMKLNRSVSYAVGILLQIHDLAGDGFVTATRIARGCRFPPRFLYRILRRMVAAGLLRGTSGPGGGYALASRAERITLLEIIEGVEGGLETNQLEPVKASQRAAIAHINSLCARQAERFAAELQQVTLADLSRKRKASAKRSRRRATSKKKK